MKIIGFIYHDSGVQMVLKGDSCLLNGRKPMFLPDGTSELGVTECVILRVSRLGKEIAPKFASRYYDAVAPGADFIAMDLARKAQEKGEPWTEAIQRAVTPRQVEKEEVIRVEIGGEEKLYCKIK